MPKIAHNAESRFLVAIVLFVASVMLANCVGAASSQVPNILVTSSLHNSTVASQQNGPLADDAARERKQSNETVSGNIFDQPEIVITHDQVRSLFGERPARLLIHYPGSTCTPGSGMAGPIYCADLQKDPFQLYMVVEHAVGGLLADPFLSPDGTRVVFGSYDYDVDGRLRVKQREQGLYVATVKPRQVGNQADRLDRELIARQGYDPRWWVHPVTGDDYIIYVNTPFSVMDDISGTTFIQKLHKGTCRPDGPPSVLIKGSAFRGGRSPDGHYICTTLPGFALAELDPLAVEDAFRRVVVSGKRLCNGSISTDLSHPDRFLSVDYMHTRVNCNSASGEVEPAPGNAPGYPYVQWCEWSTDGDYITASPSQKNDDSTPSGHDAWIYQWSTQRWVQASKRAYTTHLWVGKTPVSKTSPVPSAFSDKRMPKDKANLKRPACILSWQNGRESMQAYRKDKTPLFAAYSQPTRHGIALFDRNYSIHVGGGSFVEPRVANLLAHSLEASKMMTLMATITDEGGAGPIISLEREKTDNFALSSFDGSIVFSWKDGNRQSRKAICRITRGCPTHFALTISNGHLKVYLNGNLQNTIEIHWDPSRWKPLPFSIGQTKQGESGWDGTVEGVSIFDTTVSGEMIREMASESLSVVAKRPKVESLLLKVKLLKASPVPDPEETVYSRNYALGEYKVLNVMEGKYDRDTIVIGRWSEMDNRSLQSVMAHEGDVLVLRVEPMNAHPELQEEEVFDSLNTDLDAQPFFDVDPLRFLDDVRLGTLNKHP